MSNHESTLIPVATRWLGSWQLRVARRPLSPDSFQRAYDREAPRWHALTDRLGYPRAYRRLFRRFLTTRRIACGGDLPRVLDCGVGTGQFAMAFGKVHDGPIDLTAVDCSPSMVDAAGERFRAAGMPARVIKAQIDRLPFADASFHMVLAAHVLEHQPDPVAALAEMRRVLKPGGWIVTCMTRESWLGAWIQLKWRTHRLTPRRANEWLMAAGFHVTSLGDKPGGLFRWTSLAAIGHNGFAGSAGRETTA
ncbi:MAG: class I SAM-dependent methyltransferase [Pseudomonadota bacterium]